MVNEIELDGDDFEAIQESEDDDVLEFGYEDSGLDNAEMVAKYLEDRLGCKVDFLSADDAESYLLRVIRPGETRRPIKPSPKRNNAEIAMIVRRIKDLVKKGWCQGTSSVRNGEGKTIARCLLDAVDTVRSELDPAAIERSWGHAYDAIDLSARGAMQMAEGEGNGIVAYNEATGRTQQEIVDMLERVARHAEKGK